MISSKKIYNDNELWKYLSSKSIKRTKPFDREFIWVSLDDFNDIRHLMIQETNFLHAGRSFRSRGIFWHLHAVIQSNFVFVHWDLGNHKQFLPLGLLHLVADFFPYLLFSIFVGKPLRKIFAMPTD